MSRKRKTPKRYTGNSLKTLHRHKKARLQLATKGFLGVFEYLELQKTTAARADSESEDGAASNLNLAKGPSAKEQPRAVREEEEESDSEDGGIETVAAMPTSSITAANGTLPNAGASMTAARATSPKSPKVTPATASAAAPDSDSDSVAHSTAAPNAAAEVVVTMGVEGGVNGCLNGLQDSDECRSP
jgi:hypothetical protein